MITCCTLPRTEAYGQGQLLYLYDIWQQMVFELLMIMEQFTLLIKGTVLTTASGDLR
jgi:hypothetical protein